jgi:hypothetical protein
MNSTGDGEFPAKVYFQVVMDDIRESTEQYILHQGNCQTQRAMGLAATLFTEFPWANCYSDGTTRLPGDYCLRVRGERRVVTLFGQSKPGIPTAKEHRKLRFQWFCQALEKFIADHNPLTLAIPLRIGCGLAGGDWEGTYLPYLSGLAAERQILITAYNNEKPAEK